MNIHEKNKFEKEAKELFGSKVLIQKKDLKGESHEIFYTLVDFGGIGIEFGNKKSSNDMFYHLNAILVGPGKEDRIENIPLKDVLHAIKNSKTILYDKF